MAAHTRQFRDQLAPMSGALYDERLYVGLDELARRGTVSAGSIRAAGGGALKITQVSVDVLRVPVDRPVRGGSGGR